MLIDNYARQKKEIMNMTRAVLHAGRLPAINIVLSMFSLIFGLVSCEVTRGHHSQPTRGNVPFDRDCGFMDGMWRYGRLAGDLDRYSKIMATSEIDTPYVTYSTSRTLYLRPVTMAGSRRLR
jgi:hypothetical protein